MWSKKSGRTKPLPRYWKALRRTKLEKDNYQCQWIREDTGRICGAYATDVDHIGDPDSHRHSNLQSLCEWHHNQKTAGQGGAAVKPKIGRRQPKKHPGYQ